MTDAKLVERYAARVGADLAAPDALTTLCADLIRRHHPEVAGQTWRDDWGVWDEERLLYLVHDVDKEGDGRDLARIEQMLCNRLPDYLARPCARCKAAAGGAAAHGHLGAAWTATAYRLSAGEY